MQRNSKARAKFWRKCEKCFGKGRLMRDCDAAGEGRGWQRGIEELLEGRRIAAIIKAMIRAEKIEDVVIRGVQCEGALEGRDRLGTIFPGTLDDGEIIPDRFGLRVTTGHDRKQVSGAVESAKKDVLLRDLQEDFRRKVRLRKQRGDDVIHGLDMLVT